MGMLSSVSTVPVSILIYLCAFVFLIGSRLGAEKTAMAEDAVDLIPFLEEQIYSRSIVDPL